jgi:hypothetical protein
LATDTNETLGETFLMQKVRYLLDVGDRIVVVENVPARVSNLTGEQFFSPEIVEELHRIVHSTTAPARLAKTEIYDFDSVGLDHK